jgi:hypothetical protein
VKKIKNMHVTKEVKGGFSLAEKVLQLVGWQTQFESTDIIQQHHDGEENEVYFKDTH